MTGRTLTWFEDDDPREILRWSVAAAIVIAVHAGLIGGYLYWHQPDQAEPGEDTPVISVELTEYHPLLQEQPKVETPTPPKETSPDAVLPEEKPPEEVQPSTPQPTNTVEELAAAPRIDASWTALVRRQIDRVKSYPVGLTEHNRQGVVWVAISIGRDGHLLTHRVVKSSGYQDLDAAAIAWVERAQPLPAFPASMTQSEVDFTIPLRFRLR